MRLERKDLGQECVWCLCEDVRGGAREGDSGKEEEEMETKTSSPEDTA